MICPVCTRETSAVAELGGGADDDMSAYRGGGLRRRCAHRDCRAPLPVEKPAQPAITDRPTPTVVRVPEQVLHPASIMRGPGAAPPSFAQILSQFEARLPYVRERIAELRAYEAEERQLIAALGAAGRTTQPEDKPS